jgi:hypothetical protein
VFAPTARTTPTRLPWWWPLLAAWLLMALWSPAFASEVEPRLPSPAELAPDDDAPMVIGSWQLLTMPQMWRAVRTRSGSGAPRLLPLAVMPTERGAWWLGFSTSRATGDARVELRFTMPLDGRRLVMPHERDPD